MARTLKWGGVCLLVIALVIALAVAFSARSWGRAADRKAGSFAAELAAEAAARQSGDSQLADGLVQEVQAREAADGVLQAQITTLDGKVIKVQRRVSLMHRALFAAAKPAKGKAAATAGGLIAQFEAMKKCLAGTPCAPEPKPEPEAK